MKYKPALFMVFLVLLIFILTKSTLTGGIKLQLTLVDLLILLGYSFFLRKKGQALLENNKFVFLLISFILFLVGATGWFFSPFFFTLYLITIFLAFIFSPLVSFTFVATLVVLFSFNIGEVDLAYDFLVVLSLITSVPISLFLRREYLKLKESQKDILVLQRENEQFKSKLDEILSNKVNNFAVNIRQSINDIKLIAFMLKPKGDKDLKRKEDLLGLSNELLNTLDSFEEQVTGRKILSNQPEISDQSEVTVKEDESTPISS